MGIKKQEFYEGAALHRLARSGRIASVRYEAPFFHFNGDLRVLLKYSTRSRSPWGFTFTADEQLELELASSASQVIIGLVCGVDGIAAFHYDAYLRIAPIRRAAIHISCYRRHGEHYEVNGPDGTLARKVPPSDWRRILDEANHATP
jgi:hypothetical protein